MSNDEIIREFHKLYYHGIDGVNTHHKTKYRGVNIMKCPLDLWVYQDIIDEVKPTVIVECGVCAGGTTLFLADIADRSDFEEDCTVIGIDIDINQVNEKVKNKWNIDLIPGDSANPRTVGIVEDWISESDRVIVILDDNHEYSHVKHELELYSHLVTPGSYLIVEDTNIGGNPVLPGGDPGPMPAVREFLAAHPEFEADRSREYLLMTFNPEGFLRRKY